MVFLKIELEVKKPRFARFFMNTSWHNPLANSSFPEDFSLEQPLLEHSSSHSEDEQPNLEQVQRIYYTRGLEELESLQLLDLSPLANWKLSSYKQGYGLAQLRDDSPDTYWQSDGSNDSSSSNISTSGSNLHNPHSVTIQFSKKVSLERISIFTNFSLDESYTPSKIKVLAGSSDGWDLTEVCTVNFNKPIGWSHMIFNAMRADGVLKCFTVKLVVLANHQDGKDSHIRAIRCFGKKTLNVGDDKVSAREVYSEDGNTARILGNVTEALGTSGFQSLELRSVSSIR